MPPVSSAPGAGQRVLWEQGREAVDGSARSTFREESECVVLFFPDWKKVWTGVQRCAGVASTPG